jgi:hypothetical protein
MAKKPSFSDLYPNIAAWVQEHGWVEIGDSSDWNPGSFVQAFTLGGTAFEGETKYASLEEALDALEVGIEEWLEENG